MSSSWCTRVMPTREVVPVDLDVEVTGDADRQVVLADLEVLRHVRVEVVLPVEQRVRCDLAVEREADPHDVLDRLLVRNRERSRVAEAHGAHVRVRRRAERVAAAAEHLRGGGELDVALQPDDGLERLGHDAAKPTGGARGHRPGHSKGNRHPSNASDAMSAGGVSCDACRDWPSPAPSGRASRRSGRRCRPSTSSGGRPTSRSESSTRRSRRCCRRSVRFLVAGALLYAWTIRRGDREGDRPTRVQWRSAAIIGTLLLLGGNGGVVWAEKTIPSGVAALLVALVPLWMALLDRLFFGGHLRARALVGLVAGFGGAALLRRLRGLGRRRPRRDAVRRRRVALVGHRVAVLAQGPAAEAPVRRRRDGDARRRGGARCRRDPRRRAGAGRRLEVLARVAARAAVPHRLRLVGRVQPRTCGCCVWREPRSSRPTRT